MSRRHRNAAAESFFDGSAVADISFLLLIFFIVTSSFILRQGIFFSLPAEKARGIRVDEKDLVQVYPLKSGFQWKGIPVSGEKLVTELKKRDNRKTVLQVMMGADVPYQRMIEAFSAAKKAGIKKVSLKSL